jgi:hypothetical protein
MAQMSKEEIEKMLGKVETEQIEYDPKVDGGEEYKIRDELFKEKEKLKDVITRLKEKKRGDRKVRR